VTARAGESLCSFQRSTTMCVLPVCLQEVASNFEKMQTLVTETHERLLTSPSAVVRIRLDVL
jgi:phosphohistidine swiveling domain-containing protein